jgi:hypothetical protein
MRIPHVTDRVVGAPAQALRTMLRGVGRLLLAVDGLRRPAAEPRRIRPESKAQARWRTLEHTGNVRLLSPDELSPDELDDTPGPWAVATADKGLPADDGMAADEGMAADDAMAEGERMASDEAVSLPVPGYDGLSLPSLRARLRGLDTAQLRMLAAYEQSHAARPDVLGMFERRIVKLDSSPGGA